MDDQQHNDTYNTVHMTLEQIKQKISELSSLDLSNVHVGHEWSWMPYIKDHLEFLVDQIGGLIENLRDAPPPALPEEIKALKNET